MKLLVIVLSCQKNKNIYEKILDRNIPNVYIVTGGHSQTEMIGKLINLKCNDYYEGLPEKMICLYDFIMQNNHFDEFTHIMKTDDHDNYFDKNSIEKTEKIIQDLPQDYHYFGKNVFSVNSSNNRKWHFNKVSKDSYWDNKIYNGKYVQWCDGGSSYIVTRYAINCILKEYNTTNLDVLYKNEIYEDLCIAKCLYNHKIYPKKVLYYHKGDK